MTTLPYLDADAVLAAVSPRAAVEAIEAALRSGFDPSVDPERAVVPTVHGQMLLMPSEVGPAAGVKIATVAPANPGRGLPRIQGTYVLFAAETLTPVAIMDGAALTTIRTPAVSVAAVKSVLLETEAPLEMVVFGAGPQGVGHVATVAAVLEGRRPLGALTYVVRNPGSVDPGLRAEAAVVAAGSAAANEAVRRAGLIVCATTARTPLFDGAEVADGAIVVAVGSHEPDARELDGTLLRSSGRHRRALQDRVARSRGRHHGDLRGCLGGRRSDSDGRGGDRPGHAERRSAGCVQEHRHVLGGPGDRADHRRAAIV